MKHTSVLKLNSPIEFIESSKISPFVSKVQIKVCYVGEEPNRNHCVITKDVAKEMAPSLRGCPIVGFYNESTKDFEEHNKQITISNGEWRITDSTTPYGFIDLNAKIWFATYIDDNKVEREYLCTEGYIWDHAYPEAKRVLTNGNNHSMEFDEETLDTTWSKDQNKRPQFFIVNEALLSKLCILGEDYEPCFEGSQITAFSLVVDKSFQEKMYSMMNEIKELLTEGGTKVFNTYAVEIGDALWSALYRYIESTYPDEQRDGCSKYIIEGIYEEDGQKFAVLNDHLNTKYYRLNFSITEGEGFSAQGDLIEVTKSYTPAAEAQFSAAEVETYIKEYVKKKNEDKKDEKDKKNSEDSSEDKGKSEDEDKNNEGSSEDDDDEDKKKKKFSYDSLEEIPEYVELQNNFSNLESQVSNLNSTIENLNSELATLREFKLKAERKEKEAKIAEFYMLSDESKKDILENIDNYSLDDIEAKLSVICFRNKVSFKNDEESAGNQTTYSLNGNEEEDLSVPAWVKAALDTAKTLN